MSTDCCIPECTGAAGAQPVGVSRCSGTSTGTPRGVSSQLLGGGGPLELFPAQQAMQIHSAVAEPKGTAPGLVCHIRGCSKAQKNLHLGHQLRTNTPDSPKARYVGQSKSPWSANVICDTPRQPDASQPCGHSRQGLAGRTAPPPEPDAGHTMGACDDLGASRNAWS